MIKKFISIFLFLIAVSISTIVAQNDRQADTLFIISEGIAVTSEIPETDLTLSQEIDEAFTPIVDGLEVVLFWDPLETLDLHDPVIYDAQGKAVMDTDGEEKEIINSVSCNMVNFW